MLNLTNFIRDGFRCQQEDWDCSVKCLHSSHILHFYRLETMNETVFLRVDNCFVGRGQETNFLQAHTDSRTAL